MFEDWDDFVQVFEVLNLLFYKYLFDGGDSGFNVLFGGVYLFGGFFFFFRFGVFGNYWFIKEYSGGYVWGYIFDFSQQEMYVIGGDQRWGNFVCCFQDI